MKYLAYLSALAFVGTVFAANWALTEYGLVSVGFGLAAPAGVWFAGLAFLLRDMTQRFGGRKFVVGAILAGAGLSYLLGANAEIPGGHVSIALASCIAFLLSEFADFSIYTPLAEREGRFTLAVLASNIVGSVIDSVLFLWLAFGSLAFIQGQIVGKLWITALALPFVLIFRKRLATSGTPTYT